MPARIFPHSTADKVNGYAELVDLYNRYFQLQEELFQRLTFKLSADQVVKDGFSFKLTLEDNRGRKWIFKEKGANRIIAQRLYTLFGLETPEIHKVQLILNGKLYPGTLQEFIPGVSTLCPYAPADISAIGLKYLMKAQAMDWLMGDSDSNCSNFLVLSLDKKNRVDKLMRIDQDCACEGFESIELNYEHMVAIDKKLKGKIVANYYGQIEEACKKKEIYPDLKHAYAFVKFIADFPDAEFEKLIWDRKSRGEKSFSENDPGMLKKKFEFMVNSLVQNKRRISKGFRRLYFKLAALRGVRDDFSGIPAGSDNLEESCAGLKNKINALEKENNRSDSSPADSYVRISAIASLDGFEVMRRIYHICWFKKGDLEKECEKGLEILERIGSGAHPNEKKAISLYMQEIRKIQSGKGMTYPYGRINELIDPVLKKDKS